MEISAIGRNSAAELHDLIEIIFVEMEHVGYYPPQLMQQYRDAYALSKLVALSSDAAVLLLGAYEESLLVGFLIARQGTESNLYVEWMGILPLYRDRDIGQTLLSSAIAWAERRYLSTVSLDVSEKNIPARSFYLTQGFVVTRFWSVSGCSFETLCRTIARAQQRRAA